MEGAAAEAAAAAELLDVMEMPFSARTEVETGVSRYVFYFETESEAKAAAATLDAARGGWREAGVTLSAPVITTLLKEDWTEVWKRHFAVQRISPTLVIRPSWLEHVAAPGETVIDLDPGMSFGTGAHETTQFCLKAIEELAAGGGKSFLDAGCGSGILTIAAVKFGCSPTVCFDNDPECLETTKENLARNEIPQERVGIFVGGLEAFEPGRQFDLVVANIISSVLIANTARLASWVAPGGHLIVAGILAREYAELREAFLSAGLVEIKSGTEKDWTGGVFSRR